MLGRVVCGSRTWICTIAAPALAASMAEAAICPGVTGTAGFLPGVSAEPVTAQEILTFRCIAALRLPRPRARTARSATLSLALGRWKQSAMKGVFSQRHSEVCDDPSGSPRDRLPQHREFGLGRK